MILRSIRLEDFGLYAGIVELDLVPRRRQGGPTPIVLVGGKNGAGKTTLLEAVRLALYGRRSLGTRIGQTEYDTYLGERINRQATTRSASITLEFDYAEAGSVHRYRVRREWAARGKIIVENLLLDKDGAAVSAVPKEEWHYFLQELIPPGVSQLFFFDGEKIREIADGEEDNEQLGDAIRGLLGIELVSRLRTDLGLFLARHQKSDDATLPAKLDVVTRDITTSERKAGSISDEIAELHALRESQARAAEHIRRRFVAEGGDAAVHRARIEAEREEVRRAITRCEHEFKELSAKLLPFALAPKLVAAFISALQTADRAAERVGSLDTVLAAVEKWRSHGNPKMDARWSEKHWADLRKFLKAQGKSSSKGQTPSAFREVGDGSSALARLMEVETTTRPRAIHLLEELDTLQNRVRDLDISLSRADNAASGLMLDELLLAEQRVGGTEEKLKVQQDLLKALRGQIVMLDRDRRRLLETQICTASSEHQADLAGRAAQALANYETRLLEHKVNQLRGEFVLRFNHLARKADWIADVRIDMGTFAATLIDRNGREVPKAALSAGEKQVYAIAMLWALARTSGRALPMIIDTPLARLDSDHRFNLVDRYFPAASHQVILLSTDTEVDEQLLDGLNQSVSHSYRLDYEPTAGKTVISRGYFEASSKKERRRAI